MHQVRWLILIPAAAVSAACSRSEQPKIDDALSRDIALAASVQPYPQQQFVSPQEMGYAQPYAPQYGYGTPQGYYPMPQPQPAIYRYPAPQPAATRTRTIYRAPAPAPAPTVKRNTKRDALIGATAGAPTAPSTTRTTARGKGSDMSVRTPG